jgi:hypothetical protein
MCRHLSWMLPFAVGSLWKQVVNVLVCWVIDSMLDNLLLVCTYFGGKVINSLYFFEGLLQVMFNLLTL